MLSTSILTILLDEKVLWRAFKENFLHALSYNLKFLLTLEIKNHTKDLFLNKIFGFS